MDFFNHDASFNNRCCRHTVFFIRTWWPQTSLVESVSGHSRDYETAIEVPKKRYAKGEIN